MPGCVSEPPWRAGGPAARHRGFALLIVIWVMAVLAALATGFAAETRGEAAQARNLLESARAQGVAEAGIALAIIGLLDQNPVTQWPTDGRSREVVFDGGRVVLAIQDEGGKVNLNAAAPELIANLLSTLGVGEAERNAVVEGIVERRQAAILLAGATGGPDAAGRDDGSRLARLRNPAFRAIDEIRQFPTVTRALYDRITPFVTVFSQTPRINHLTASPEILRSLPNVNPQEVDAVLAARAALVSGEPPVPIPLLTGVDRYAGRTVFRAATIVAKATTESGATFVRQAVVLVTGKPDRPYELLDWRQVVAGDGNDGAGH